MSHTIQVRFIYYGQNTKSTKKYLASQDIKFDPEKDEITLFVELVSLPHILVQLRKAGLYEGMIPEGDTFFWSFTSLTEQGINLYMTYDSGDGWILIPQHNIIAMHTISDKQLQEIKDEVNSRL